MPGSRSRAVLSKEGASSLTPLQYLEKHNIAPLLNTAVNELGKAQPADPVPWLAKWLADKGKQ